MTHQYAAVGVLSFPLFWAAGAGSAVFWVIGTSREFSPLYRIGVGAQLGSDSKASTSAPGSAKFVVTQIIWWECLAVASKMYQLSKRLHIDFE